MQTREKYVKIAAIATTALSLVVLLIFSIILPAAQKLTRPSFLSLSIAPNNAIINIDGKDYTNGEYKFKPGKYHASIKAEGFENKELDFEVKRHQRNQILDYLENKKQGLNIFEKNKIDLQILHKIDSEAQNTKDEAQLDKFKKVSLFIKNYDKKLEINNKLPIEFTYDGAKFGKGLASFFINADIEDGSQDYDCNYAFCIRIKNSHYNPESAKEAANAKLKELGYNLGDYHVIYD